MAPGQLTRAPALDEDRVDDVATENRHAPPPSLVARTMSCDIRELCGELRHPRRHQVLAHCALGMCAFCAKRGTRGQLIRAFCAKRGKNARVRARATDPAFSSNSRLACATAV